MHYTWTLNGLEARQSTVQDKAQRRSTRVTEYRPPVMGMSESSGDEHSPVMMPVTPP